MYSVNTMIVLFEVSTGKTKITKEQTSVEPIDLGAGTSGSSLLEASMLYTHTSITQGHLIHPIIIILEI